MRPVRSTDESTASYPHRARKSGDGTGRARGGPSKSAAGISAASLRTPAAPSSRVHSGPSRRSRRCSTCMMRSDVKSSGPRPRCPRRSGMTHWRASRRPGPTRAPSPPERGPDGPVDRYCVTSEQSIRVLKRLSATVEGGHESGRCIGWDGRVLGRPRDGCALARSGHPLGESGTTRDVALTADGSTVVGGYVRWDFDQPHPVGTYAPFIWTRGASLQDRTARPLRRSPTVDGALAGWRACRSWLAKRAANAQGIASSRPFGRAPSRTAAVTDPSGRLQSTTEGYLQSAIELNYE